MTAKSPESPKGESEPEKQAVDESFKILEEIVDSYRKRAAEPLGRDQARSLAMRYATNALDYARTQYEDEPEDDWYFQIETSIWEPALRELNVHKKWQGIKRGLNKHAETHRNAYTPDTDPDVLLWAKALDWLAKKI